MLTIYESNGKGLKVHDPAVPITWNCVWFEVLGIDIPTRAEMREIEPSNRFYQERGAYFMTASIVYNVEAPVPLTTPVTFILAGDRLVTVCYAEPKAFPLYMQRDDKGDAPCATGAYIMIGLLEALIHRKADLIERIQDEVDKLAAAVFDLRGGKQTRNRRFDVLLRGTGKATHERGDDPRIRQRIKGAHRDINSLMDHTKFLSGRITFILDATLGMISTEQNQIIKLFSVMAVILLPPTLVASVYGMNFTHMPELAWTYGYPWALVLMVLAAVGPIVYFRRKGWF